MANFWATNSVDTATTAITQEMLDKTLANMRGPKVLQPEPWVVPAWFARMVATDPRAYDAVSHWFGKDQADGLQRLGRSL
jgi:hypothetical protein